LLELALPEDCSARLTISGQYTEWDLESSEKI
jgi:hypothetical protein